MCTVYHMTMALGLDLGTALTASEFAAAVAEHERQAAVLALQLRRLETSDDWAADSHVSLAAWLRDVCRMSNRTAHAWVHRARLLDTYGEFAAAAVSGALSAGQLDALQTLHRPKYEAHLAEHHAELVDLVRELNVADTQTVCRHWRADADAVIDAEQPPTEPDRSLTFGRDGDGTLIGRFALDGAAATELEKAIRNAITFDGDDDQRSQGERNADALFDITAFYNKNHDSDGTPRHLPNVSISVDEATIRAGRPEGIDDDTQEPVDTACADAKLCDCQLHTILRDIDGAPISFGRTRYTVSRKLFRQVAARDGGCRIPGCNRKVRHCDAHHIRYWRRGGPTDYDNLVLLCSRHHHMVHQLDLQLKLLPNGELHVTWPDGHERVSHPRGAPPKPRSAR
jgi:hypothetical protein